MNGAENGTRFITARLPSGELVRVALAASGSGDELTSVGLRDLDLDKAMETVAEIGSLVVGKLKVAKPSRATVELRLGFAIEAGKLTALWLNGRGDASLTVTLEWSRPPAPIAGDDG
jgi:Trypsin-co-occurring domain 1